MHRKIVFPAIVAMLAILTLSVLPANAWVYPDSTSDAKWEQFGPRADKLLIKLYADDLGEFAALEAGDIDIVDWPIPKLRYQKWTSPPWNETIKVVNYGPEFGLYIIDMNSNNNQYLGNPPNPAYPNPVADRDPTVGNPNIGGGAGTANDYNPMSNVWLRRAIDHLIDRDGIIALPEIGAGFGFPMYTTMPPGMAKYLYPVYGDPSIPWAWEYNPAAAAAMLTANGFPINAATGKRFWDRNGDGVEQADEYVEILQYYRSDHPGRRRIGEILRDEMIAINLRVNPKPVTSGAGFVAVMVNKNFHMYTGGWSLGVDPDHLILWAWDYYWHPGFSYNYGGHNDPAFNDAADGIMYANTQDEAVAQAYLAQYRQAYMVLSAPVYCVSGNKAYRRTYSGPETPYNGKPWLGIVNIYGYGIDNGATLSNMHPQGYERDLADPANPMTIRYGFKVPDIKQLNPVYASWLFDWNVLDNIYSEGLVGRNASDLGEFLPNLVSSFEVGTYLHPVYGESSKVRFTLRPDVTFHDGVPMTVADVHFTFVEMKNILISRGLPYPWWWSSVQNILSFSILDPYNFEVLLDVKSYWALGWVGGMFVLPKHIWKPIAETGDPQTFAPDPNMIGSSSWRFVEYVENSHVLLVANKPGRTVTTALPGSTAITSPQGYFAFHPFKADTLAVTAGYEGRAKLPYDTEIDYESAFQNLMGMYASEVNTTVTMDFLNGTEKRYINDITLVPARRFAPVIDFHFRARHVDYGFSAVKYTDLPGPMEALTYWKRLYIRHFGVLIITLNGVPVASIVVNGLQAINIYRYAIIPDGMSYLPHDRWWLVDLELSWHTIKEDIAGSTWYDDAQKYIIPINPPPPFPGHYPFGTYPYKSQLPSPDIKVDIKDVALAAKAFGSYPGHARWSTVADLNLDYKIDIKDIAAIAKKFGWVG